MQYFDKHVKLDKVGNRSVAFTIDGTIELIKGTDLASLFALGRAGLARYVESGFKELPAKVELRTDSKQKEAENIGQEDIDDFITAAAEMENELLLDSTRMPNDDDEENM